jgi:alpha,alpha-trehalase
MFEKFSISDIDSAGRGGEYTVQAGFGWTNGVVLILASEYGNVLVAPQCPDILAQVSTMGGSTTTTSSNSAFSARGLPSGFAVALSGMALVAYLL